MMAVDPRVAQLAGQARRPEELLGRMVARVGVPPAAALRLEVDRPPDLVQGNRLGLSPEVGPARLQRLQRR